MWWTDTKQISHDVLPTNTSPLSTKVGIISVMIIDKQNMHVKSCQLFKTFYY